MRDPIVVLKFGSSVLRSADDLPRAVLEIYRERRRGRRVVAVVSAFGETTDTLLRSARERFAEPDPDCLARLLETGESAAAATLGLALAEAGVPARVYDAAQLDLRTDDAGLDAQPVALDAAGLRRRLDEVGVAVVPGFSGRAPAGGPALLGRGGSDLTALFLAAELQAQECRLLKDVDGLLPVGADGALDWSRRFARATFADCLRHGGPLVQPKSVEYAAARRQPFTVAACGSAGGTLVGAPASQLEPFPARRPVRVALAGLGTVGLGVLRWLRALDDGYEVVGVLVGDLHKRRPDDAPPELLVGCGDALLARRPDLVVEMIGGTDAAGELVSEARRRGLPVISANKHLLSTAPDLRRAAAAGGDLACSAAVGGSVPALETASRLAAEEPVTAIAGIINGTCNYLLDRFAAGDDLEAALDQARRRGLAEDDPHLDLSGWDCAHKLSLLCAAAFGCELPPGDVVREGIGADTPHRVALARRRGAELRLVAEARLRRGRPVATVRLRELRPGDALHGCASEANRLLVVTASGRREVVDGLGAGRRPTALAVTADLLDVRGRLGTTAGEAAAVPA